MDGTNCKGGGVAVNNELFFKLGLAQDRGSADSIDDGSKCGVVFIVPVKLPSLHAMGNKHIEWCSQDAKSANVHPIKVQEAKECPNFFQSCGSVLVLHALDFDWVHGNRVLANNYAEILHFGGFELAFLGFEVEVVSCENAQHIIDDMAV